MRLPRLVSWNTFCMATRAYPAEQRRRASLKIAYGVLMAAHVRERKLHRVKVEECESLKRLLPPDVLAAWKAWRKP